MSIHPTRALTLPTGIGNTEILRNAGIEPLVELPGVGENLQVRVESVGQVGRSYWWTGRRAGPCRLLRVRTSAKYAVHMGYASLNMSV